MMLMKDNSREEKEFFKTVHQIEDTIPIERNEVETILCLIRTTEGVEMLKQFMKEQEKEPTAAEILHEVSKISRKEEQFIPWDEEENEED